MNPRGPGYKLIVGFSQEQMGLFLAPECFFVSAISSGGETVRVIVSCTGTGGGGAVWHRQTVSRKLAL